jgi:hypothetical protein
MNIITIIKYIAFLNDLNVDFSENVIVRKTAEGVYIDKWDLPIPKPTIEELTALEHASEIWVNSTKYINERKVAYPSISDQLDMLYWDKVNGTNTWLDKITEIKEKYPKS